MQRKREVCLNYIIERPVGLQLSKSCNAAENQSPHGPLLDDFPGILCPEQLDGFFF